jgi:proteasome assembly chaperone (PAC2) family protein
MKLTREQKIRATVFVLELAEHIETAVDCETVEEFDERMNELIAKVQREKASMKKALD